MRLSLGSSKFETLDGKFSGMMDSWDKFTLIWIVEVSDFRETSTWLESSGCNSHVQPSVKNVRLI